jgi:hypothetical protein
VNCVTRSTSAPDAGALPSLPHVFVDRSLGAVQLPKLLRAAGVQLTFPGTDPLGSDKSR